MRYLPSLLQTLNEQALKHQDDVFNYAIPNAWNVYGFPAMRKLHSQEILVNPYAFYAYTLQHILQDEEGNIKPAQIAKAKDTSWLRSTSIYGLMVRTAGSWDHDRDEQIDTANLYALRDQGTFLKCIALLPLWKRMGIRTILLHQPFETGTTALPHLYPKKEAITHFQKIQEALKDPMLPDMSALEQCVAFIEACHVLGIRVILEYCPGKIARENAYIAEHPEWFYWIDKAKEAGYQPPVCHTLPQNTIPHTYTLRDFYRSEQVREHIAIFKEAPSSAMLKADASTLEVTTAPYFSDQINASIPADKDTTPLRFYTDQHPHIPEDVNTTIPYVTQDVLRADLHPGKTAMKSLWDMVCENILWYQDTLQIDGIYVAKAFLIPEELQIQMAKTAHKHRSDFVMIAEDGIMDNGEYWLEKGYDAISGSMAYEERQLQNNRFHDIAYRLKSCECPMLAASEFFDSPRIRTGEHGEQAAITLTVMNHFLPNGIPYIENGWECFETQPLQLSEYGNEASLHTLPLEDSRAGKQGFLDAYYFNYRHPEIRSVLDIMTKIQSIRNSYLDTIIQPEKCIPVWFDDPKDPGIGFTYIKEDRALMVVCNSQIDQSTYLHIHTENLFFELPFNRTSIRQIYTTTDPYVHEITLDDFQNIPMDFMPGEVKFIEIK